MDGMSLGTEYTWREARAAWRAPASDRGGRRTGWRSTASTSRRRRRTDARVTLPGVGLCAAGGRRVQPRHRGGVVRGARIGCRPCRTSPSRPGGCCRSGTTWSSTVARWLRRTSSCTAGLRLTSGAQTFLDLARCCRHPSWSRSVTHCCAPVTSRPRRLSDRLVTSGPRPRRRPCPGMRAPPVAAGDVPPGEPAAVLGRDGDGSRYRSRRSRSATLGRVVAHADLGYPEWKVAAGVRGPAARGRRTSSAGTSTATR